MCLASIEISLLVVNPELPNSIAAQETTARLISGSSKVASLASDFTLKSTTGRNGSIKSSARAKTLSPEPIPDQLALFHSNKEDDDE